MPLKINNDLIGMEFDPVEVQWTSKDTMLYALGVGAKPDDELDYLYEAKGPKVLPTYAVCPGFNLMLGVVEKVEINLMMLLHGEQVTTLHRLIPPNAKGRGVAKIVEVWDKGKAAVIGLEGTVSDDDGPIFTNKATLFVRGAGDFGGDRGPSTKGVNVPPEREPDHVVEDITLPQQAALYRLSGDPNPIHIDPEFAKLAGFEKPFLHGLCTFGFGCRAALKALCKNNPGNFKSIQGRFADQVYMGDKLITKMWETTEGEALVQMETQKGNVILSQAKITYKP
jgi:acyl dehydratase